VRRENDGVIAQDDHLCADGAAEAAPGTPEADCGRPAETPIDLRFWTRFSRKPPDAFCGAGCEQDREVRSTVGQQFVPRFSRVSVSAMLLHAAFAIALYLVLRSLLFCDSKIHFAISPNGQCSKYADWNRPETQAHCATKFCFILDPNGGLVVPIGTNSG
jgi:hypothetical protein